MKGSKSIEQQKPGWTSRVFGIASGRLVACDATFEQEEWTRTEPFRFLYRGRSGGFYLLSKSARWDSLPVERARELFRHLPVRLVSEDAAFAAPSEAP